MKKQRNTRGIFVTSPGTKMAFGRPGEDNVEVILEKRPVRNCTDQTRLGSRQRQTLDREWDSDLEIILFPV
jgi:hypothetical protein